MTGGVLCLEKVQLLEADTPRRSDPHARSDQYR
jgi:hypothetical protein